MCPIFNHVGYYLALSCTMCVSYAYVLTADSDFYLLYVLSIISRSCIIVYIGPNTVLPGNSEASRDFIALMCLSTS